MTAEPGAVRTRVERRDRGLSPVAIVLPSVVSGIGVFFILLALLINHRIIQDICLTIGLVLLWLDFFITMAILRHALRNIDRRLRRLEAAARRSDS